VSWIFTKLPGGGLRMGPLLQAGIAKQRVVADKLCWHFLCFRHRYKKLYFSTEQLAGGSGQVKSGSEP